MTKAEQNAINTVLDYTIEVLKRHPDLSAFDPDSWALSWEAGKMELLAVCDLEIEYDEGDAE